MARLYRSLGSYSPTTESRYILLGVAGEPSNGRKSISPWMTPTAIMRHSRRICQPITQHLAQISHTDMAHHQASPRRRQATHSTEACNHIHSIQALNRARASRDSTTSFAPAQRGIFSDSGSGWIGPVLYPKTLQKAQSRGKRIRILMLT